jgi:hypothetical protein
MLPLQQAYEVKQSIIEYLKATFSFKEKVVSGVIEAYKATWVYFEEVFKSGEMLICRKNRIYLRQQ